MTIGIDTSRANRPHRTGTEWYAYHVIQALKTVVPPDVRVRLYSREPLAGDLRELPPNWEAAVLSWPPRYFWTLVRLSWEMWRRPPDVLFVPAHGLPLRLPEASVVAIHDIGFDRFPELYRWRQRRYHRFVVRRALRRATRVVTISAFTERELAAVYRPPHPPVVIPLAHDAAAYHDGIPEAAQRQAQDRYGVRPPYFISVGRLEKKKNVVRTVAAFAQFLHRSVRPQQTGQNSHTLEYESFDQDQGAAGEGRGSWSLVLVGPRGYGFQDVVAVAEETGVSSAVRVLDWVASADLPSLVAGARALVFPSLYEGFGIPILEAMAVGTPVITSDRGATAEVAGVAAALVNPEDVGAVSGAMAAVAGSPTFAAELRAAGFVRARQFTWERTARETWAVLAAAASSSAR